MTSNDLRQQVNQKLIAALSQNILPWRRPWFSCVGGRHRNLQSQRAYSGVNPLLLELHNMKHGLASNQWATFKQWQALGCSVKKRPTNVPSGQWGCNVIFCKPCSKKVMHKETGEEEKAS